MSVTWGKTDKQYFHKLGITVDDRKPGMYPSVYIFVSWFLFWLVAGGMAWYGLLRLAAWALRHLGVVITGI